MDAQRNACPLAICSLISLDILLICLFRLRDAIIHYYTLTLCIVEDVIGGGNNCIKRGYGYTNTVYCVSRRIRINGLYTNLTDVAVISYVISYPSAALQYQQAGMLYLYT